MLNHFQRGVPSLAWLAFVGNIGRRGFRSATRSTTTSGVARQMLRPGCRGR